MDIQENLHKSSEMDHITRLIIEKDWDANANNTEYKVKFDIRSILVSRGQSDNEHQYYKLKDLSHTKSVSIILKEGDERKEVYLPGDMMERIGNFVKNMENEYKNCDCGNFIEVAFGVYETRNAPKSPGLDLSQWNGKWFDGNIKPGEAIAIVNRGIIKHDYRHFAVYIGDGLYISKFGGTGALIVCNIEEMKKGFLGKDVIKMELKSSVKANL